MGPFNAAIGRFADKNPAISGPNADMWSMIPFIGLVLLLWLTGREKILAPKETS